MNKPARPAPFMPVWNRPRQAVEAVAIGGDMLTLNRSFWFRAPKMMERALWWGVCVIAVFTLFTTNQHSFKPIVGGIMVGAASLVPMYLWCSGRVGGMPVFPLCAIIHFVGYGYPLLIGPGKLVYYYTDNDMMKGGLTMTAFILVGTVAWWSVARKPPVLPHTCRCANVDHGFWASLFYLCFDMWLVVVSLAGWLAVPSGIQSILRAGALSLALGSIFVVAYQVAHGTRKGFLATASLWAIRLSIVVSVTSASMHWGIFRLVVFHGAWFLGRRKVRWLELILSFCIFGFLHMGKGTMRTYFWSEGFRLAPTQYVQYYSIWAESSYHAVVARNKGATEQENFVERLCVIHYLLKVMALSPDSVPFLNGWSYSQVPAMLVPRIINPNKPHSHVATNLIAVRYGIQTQEGTESTTISVGMLGEAFANFGYFGLMGLAIFYGLFYGTVARWCSLAPLFSMRYMFGAICLYAALNYEWTSPVFCSVIFQYTIVLTVISFVFMRPTRVLAPKSAMTQPQFDPRLLWRQRALAAQAR